ncbi:UDP-N-acetylenolpyruvoylglucosamine reductase [Anopheles sinensis]|uniref:UDP-N-acetylenolpyruvoylglucosamine reductase n=1 Tax=Anopheles sinensis TaxID=74873 RepID=A0A084WT79_ANOSI|nr:UDP-N-acetylenolpyruvoylglucosamine reductase [Anopheles sinensis]
MHTHTGDFRELGTKAQMDNPFETEETYSASTGSISEQAHDRQQDGQPRAAAMRCIEACHLGLAAPESR